MATEIQPSDVVVDITDIEGVVAALRWAREQEAAAKERKEQLEDEVKARLGEQGTVAVVNGAVVATYRESPTKKVDVKALRADAPEVAAKYEKHGSSRRFDLK